MVTNWSIYKQAKAVFPFFFFALVRGKIFFLSDVGFGGKRETSFKEDPESVKPVVD